MDSSTLISLARSGNVGLLLDAPLDVVIPEVAWTETVAVGVAAGHADAQTVADRLGHLRRVASPSGADAGVLEVAVGSQGLICDDIALGRRARSLGIRWLRTADFVVLLVRTSRIGRRQGRSAIVALRESGRLDARGASEYLRELE